MSDFSSMGGYGWYVAMAYGACALAIVVEAVALRARRRRALAEAFPEGGTAGELR
ncbi:MAG: heme exporter protein CcmD [Burkholderiales bacterium]|nr:heme exporter protein CcmD [Burkholderiales bacterium]MCE7878935.1 heme exporter protein CcmD [Betaproteobacteria bacterium PRO3]